MFGWSFWYHVIKALTMTKIANIYTKIENNTFQFAVYNKHNIEKNIDNEN